jgi:hypothetical protein
VNTENIADLTIVVDKLVSQVELHVKSGGHDVMKERMSTMEEGFLQMKDDIREILRRTPR